MGNPMKKVTKKIILSGLCILGTVNAFADIPAPPHPPVSPPQFHREMYLSGKDATEFAAKLESEWIRGASMRHGSSKYKVFRSTSGLTQIVCEIWSKTMVDSDNCTITQSTTGEALPRFHPSRPMG